ncbi:MAG: 4Fe-4S single cluster domain-containing protein [Deltaproteobacteria bacterium]|nr:4Fe-4S single cluster domain-containing protein [Deltaproteobacteria bacterium]
MTLTSAEIPAINAALVIEETEAEGPGMRLALWVQGCPMRCAGCCNPEFLPEVPAREITAKFVLARAVARGVEGLSLLGGEPFAQAKSLANLAQGAQALGLSVMVYSGYTLAELHAMPDPDVHALLAATDLLVDGRYDHTRRTTTRRWIGSDNQVLHFLTSKYVSSDPRFAQANTVELRMVGGRLLLNGWPTLGARTRVEERKR